MMAANLSQSAEFAHGLRGELLVDESMSKHTSWRTGGRAQYFYTPEDRKDLELLLSQLPGDLSIYWIGLGSNLLVRDQGVSGIVIRTAKGLRDIRLLENQRLYAESGVACAKVARIAAKNQLQGVEFLAGVPGSFGGALAMNAGAFGGETWERVEFVDCIDRKGHVHTFQRDEIEYGYRTVKLPENMWILGGVVRLEKTGPEYRGRDRIKSLLERRASTQPIQSANAGSVFRNPEGGFAAELIEQAGLKGRACGGAVVSEVHANFIVNRGDATSSDIERLIRIIQQEVNDKSGIELELEVKILGDSD